MSERVPHFVIAGAPKSGTTSLYKYLLQHPNVFMPNKKEPVFFCGYERNFRGPGSEVFNDNLVVDREEYLSLFSLAPKGSLTGEASTDYLSCPRSPSLLKEWSPATKVVICLRNPIERAYSEHMHLVRDVLETKNFREALELEDERTAKNWIPLFWHVKRGLYYEAVRRYLDEFGSQRVKIILYDELVFSPALVVDELFEFLGIQRMSVELSKHHNVSGHPKLRKLQTFLLYENHVKSAVKKLAPQKIRTRIKEAILSANLRKDVMSAEDFEYLREKFVVDIEKLQRLLKVDLQHWMQPEHLSTQFTAAPREDTTS